MVRLVDKFAAKLKTLGVEGLSREDQRGMELPNDPPISVGMDELVAFEKELGAELPREYRDFLLDFGGALFIQICVRPIEIREDYGDIEIFELLFGGADHRPNDLWSNYAVYKDRIPNHMIPIGANLFSDVFCMAMTGPDRGKVYFWNHDDSTVHLTANSFEDFLERLEPYPS